MIKKKRAITIFLLATFLSFHSLPGKGEAPKVEQVKTITLHNSSGLAGSADAMVEKFNNTVGKEQNIESTLSTKARQVMS